MLTAFASIVSAANLNYILTLPSDHTWKQETCTQNSPLRTSFKSFRLSVFQPVLQPGYFHPCHPHKDACETAPKHKPVSMGYLLEWEIRLVCVSCISKSSMLPIAHPLLFFWVLTNSWFGYLFQCFSRN